MDFGVGVAIVVGLRLGVGIVIGLRLGVGFVVGLRLGVRSRPARVSRVPEALVLELGLGGGAKQDACDDAAQLGTG